MICACVPPWFLSVMDFDRNMFGYGATTVTECTVGWLQILFPLLHLLLKQALKPPFYNVFEMFSIRLRIREVGDKLKIGFLNRMSNIYYSEFRAQTYVFLKARSIEYSEKAFHTHL